MSANPPSLSEIAAFVGSPARANMLTALLDGRALTASELAHAGGVAPHTPDGPARYQPRWRGGDRARSKAPLWRLTTRISSRSLNSEFKFRVPH
jgi:hypothetical protein